jgi:hypothetical protein
MSFKDDLRRRAAEYANLRGLGLSDELGCGVHGIVFATESQLEEDRSAVRSAIKVHQQEAAYRRERDVYLRLHEHGVTSVRGCHIPRLLDYNDRLWILEMTIVKRPFVLDFAGAYLHQPPDFSDEVMADWRAEKQEQFGDRWPEVQAILGFLEGYGVFMVDVNPGNVYFGD